VRRGVAYCAAALVRVLQELAAGEATNDAKMAYAQAMPHCERLTGLAPLETALRIVK
jgi:hypothetical protein